MSILLFANRPRLRVVFSALTTAALAVLALRFGALVLASVAGVTLAGTAARYRIAGCAERLRTCLRSDFAQVPDRIEEAPDDVIRKAFLAWRTVSESAGLAPGRPRAIATAVRGIYDAALVPSAGWAVRVTLAIVYLGLLVPTIAIVSTLGGF